MHHVSEYKFDDEYWSKDAFNSQKGPPRIPGKRRGAVSKTPTRPALGRHSAETMLTGLLDKLKNKQSIHEFVRLFRAVDTDSDIVITKREMGEGLKRMNFNFTEQDLCTLLDMMHQEVGTNLHGDFNYLDVRTYARG